MNEKISELEIICDRLRSEMHDAPMNKMFTRHDGSRHLGTHSMAWAVKGREWCEARRKLEEAKLP